MRAPLLWQRIARDAALVVLLLGCARTLAYIRARQVKDDAEAHTQ